jgi:GTP-binding protein Era
MSQNLPETSDTGSSPDAFETPPGHRSGYVAVVGRPNVGKSTLVNAILGQKIAIVSPKPQTTRIRQLGILTRDDAQIVFIDTPGIHQPHHALGEFMVEVAVQALRDADVVLFLSDVSKPPGPSDRNVADILKRAGEAVRVIRVLNKVDQARDPDAYLQIVEAHLALVPYAEWATTVAVTGEGATELVDRLLPYLPEGPRYYEPDQVSDLWMREIAGEMIREAALYFTEAEVPHALAVAVNEYKERPNGMVYIAADLFVERDSQKAILIGKGGAMVKQISQRARTEIEAFLATRVYLELHVKVLKNWRRDENALRRLGYRIER